MKCHWSLRSVPSTAADHMTRETPNITRKRGSEKQRLTRSDALAEQKGYIYELHDCLGPSASSLQVAQRPVHDHTRCVPRLRPCAIARCLRRNSYDHNDHVQAHCSPPRTRRVRLGSPNLAMVCWSPFCRAQRTGVEPPRGARVRHGLQRRLHLVWPRAGPSLRRHAERSEEVVQHHGCRGDLLDEQRNGVYLRPGFAAAGDGVRLRRCARRLGSWYALLR